MAESVAAMGLKYVVITSVDRDDLRDGGAQHFADCINEIRKTSPNTKIEILVPDFRGRLDIALEILAKNPPDVMNHNLETHPRLYKQARWGGLQTLAGIVAPLPRNDAAYPNEIRHYGWLGRNGRRSARNHARYA